MAFASVGVFQSEHPQQIAVDGLRLQEANLHPKSENGETYLFDRPSDSGREAYRCTAASTCMAGGERFVFWSDFELEVGARYSSQLPFDMGSKQPTWKSGLSEVVRKFCEIAMLAPGRKLRDRFRKLQQL